MLIEEEIEKEIEAGTSPLFIYGLIQMCEEGWGKQLTAAVDRIGQKIYLQKEKEACDEK